MMTECSAEIKRTSVDTHLLHSSRLTSVTQREENNQFFDSHFFLDSYYVLRASAIASFSSNLRILCWRLGVVNISGIQKRREKMFVLRRRFSELEERRETEPKDNRFPCWILWVQFQATFQNISMKKEKETKLKDFPSIAYSLGWTWNLQRCIFSSFFFYLKRIAQRL